MNIYDDYHNFVNENTKLINTIKRKNSILTSIVNPVLMVSEHIYNSYTNNDLMDPVDEEVFQLAYGYLANIIQLLDYYHKEYFNSDSRKFNNYSNIMYYSLHLDDFKSYLVDNNLYKDADKDKVNDLENYLEQLMKDQHKVDEDTVSIIEEKLTSIAPAEQDYMPAYKVFYMMAEEYGLFEKGR